MTMLKEHKENLKDEEAAKLVEKNRRKSCFQPKK